MSSSYVVGWKEVGTVFGVPVKTVKVWHEQGAPILLLGEKPVTRLDDLWLWLLEHRQALEVDSSGMSAAAAKAVIPEDGEKALLAAVLAKGGRHGR